MAEAGESLYGLWPVRHWVGQADAGFVDTVGLGIDDVAAWVGPDLSAGLAETRDGSLRAAGTAGVRDHAAASEFMSRWIAYWERETGTSFRRYSTGDATVWAGDGNGWMGDHAYALLPDMLAFATSRDVLDELLVRVDGTEASSLEDSPSFTEARQVASGKRFASVFLDHRWLSRQLWPWGGSCAEGMMGTPRWLSMSARWEEKALVFDFVAPGRLAWGTVEELDTEQVGAAISADGFGVLALAFDPKDPRWVDQLQDCPLGEYVEIQEIEAITPWPFDLAGRFVDPSRPVSGNAARLADDPTYQQTISLVVPPEALLYLNTETLLRRDVQPGDLAFHRLYDPQDFHIVLTETINAMALSVGRVDGYVKATVMLSLTED